MTVTFVLPAFMEPYAAYVSLGSLLCQTNPNWKAIVMHNGANYEMQDLVLDHIADTRITYQHTAVNTGCPDHSRDIALTHLVDTEFTVTASVQDYFLPGLVDEIIKAAEGGANFIMWNGMNHHYMDNHMHYTRPEINWTDWCNFATLTEIAKKVGIGLDPAHAHHPDGVFAEAVMKLPETRFKKIEKLLVIHS